MINLVKSVLLPLGIVIVFWGIAGIMFYNGVPKYEIGDCFVTKEGNLIYGKIIEVDEEKYVFSVKMRRGYLLKFHAPIKDLEKITRWVSCKKIRIRRETRFALTN